MKNIKLILISIVAVISLFFLGLFAVLGFQNTAINLEEQIKTASSDIEVQEKRRVDLIYNLVDCVKQYDKHESETLKSVVDGRAASSGDISDVTTMIAATAEAYPDLKSNTNYKELMNEMSITENMIAEYRSNYNAQVKSYNRYVRKPVNKFFLNVQGYEVLDVKALEYNAPSTAPQNLFGE